MQVSITSKQMKRNIGIGNSLLSSGLISGFNLEDFNPHSRKSLIYAHDSPRHLSTVQKNIDGKQYPRFSFYRWNPKWKKGENTKIIQRNTLAKAKEAYIQTKKINQANRYIKKRAVRGLSKHPIAKSWFVPDVRIYGERKARKDFRNAYLVTKKIDSNSRLAMLMTNKTKLAEVRERLKREKVWKVKVQNYKNTKNSFYSFIS